MAEIRPLRRPMIGDMTVRNLSRRHINPASTRFPVRGDKQDGWRANLDG
jgi:hypothetical protein